MEVLGPQLLFGPAPIPFPESLVDEMRDEVRDHPEFALSAPYSEPSLALAYLAQNYTALDPGKGYKERAGT